MITKDVKLESATYRLVALDTMAAMHAQRRLIGLAGGITKAPTDASAFTALLGSLGKLSDSEANELIHSLIGNAKIANDDGSMTPLFSGVGVLMSAAITLPELDALLIEAAKLNFSSFLSSTALKKTLEGLMANDGEKTKADGSASGKGRMSIT